MLHHYILWFDFSFHQIYIINDQTAGDKWLWYMAFICRQLTYKSDESAHSTTSSTSACRQLATRNVYRVVERHTSKSQPRDMFRAELNYSQLHQHASLSLTSHVVRQATTSSCHHTHHRIKHPWTVQRMPPVRGHNTLVFYIGEGTQQPPTPTYVISTALGEF
jgi:hypothetical protein